MLFQASLLTPHNVAVSPCSFISRHAQGFTRNLLLLFCRYIKAARFPGLVLLLIFHVWEHTLDLSLCAGWVALEPHHHNRAAWSTIRAFLLSSSRLTLPFPPGQHKRRLPPHTNPTPWGQETCPGGHLSLGHHRGKLCSGREPLPGPQVRAGRPEAPAAPCCAPSAAAPPGRPPAGRGAGRRPGRRERRREERGEERRGGGGGRRPESFPG